MSLAKHVLHLRTKMLLLTQRELGDKLGVDPMTVSRWERGKVDPSLAHLRSMAMLAGVEPSWFFKEITEEVAV